MAPATAAAGDFMDTRITFVVTDDDVLHNAGETTPSSPTLSFGARDGRILFFENHNRRTAGDETQAHLVLYKSMEGYIPRLTTEAALVLQFDPGRQLAGDKRAWWDDGTYVKLIWDLASAPKDKLELTLFPYDTERFKLGYSYQLSWGGSRIFGRGLQGPAPGVKLSLNLDAGEGASTFGFIGAKTAHIQKFAEEESSSENDEIFAFYAVLAGVGHDTGLVRAEINGGYFQRGTHPRRHVRGLPVDAVGASLQVALHDGLDVQKSADFRLYRNDPTRIPSASVAHDTTDGWVLAAEASVLAHSLEDPDSIGGTRLQQARAGDINLVVRTGRWEPYADLIFRDLAFVLFNVPSFVPYLDFSDQVEVVPEVWGSVGVNYHMPEWHLTPGIAFGVQRPSAVIATTELPTGQNEPDVLEGKRTVVVRREGRLTILPDDKDVVPIFAAKLQARWDMSPMASLIGEAFFQFDENRSELEDDTSGVATRVFEDPLVVGFSILTQARF